MIRTHFGQHDDCYGCKLASINFGAAAMPTRREHAVQCAQTEAQWDKDHGAYKQLRKDGLQPRTSAGAHDLMMRASTREEVEGLPKLHADRHDILTGTAPGSA